MRCIGRLLIAPRSLNLIAAAILIAATSCARSDSQQFDPKLVKEYNRRIAAYDSVVRSINTDTVYGLWRALLVADDPQAALMRVQCAYARLEYRYGANAVFDADKRMRDTLWRGVSREALARMTASVADVDHSMGRGTCDPMPTEHAPKWLVDWTIYPLPQLPPSATDSSSRH